MAVAKRQQPPRRMRSHTSRARDLKRQLPYSATSGEDLQKEADAYPAQRELGGTERALVVRDSSLRQPDVLTVVEICRYYYNSAVSYALTDRGEANGKSASAGNNDQGWRVPRGV